MVNHLRSPHSSHLLGSHVVTLQIFRDLVADSNLSMFDFHLKSTHVQYYDPMNVPHVHALFEQKTIDYLEKISAATQNDSFGALIVLLRALQSVMYAFVEHRRPSYSILDRIRDIYASVVFFRLWRADLAARKESADRCFITSNAWESLELSAHSFVYLVCYLHAHHPTAMLRPWGLGSQANEHVFRGVRAFTPIESTDTSVNAVVFMNRIENLLANREALGQLGYVHMRHGSASATDIQYPLPQVHN